MDKTLKLFANYIVFDDDTILASIGNKDYVEYNLEEISRFANIDFSELKENGLQMFRILNYVCFVSAFHDYWHMNFSNRMNSDDKILDFYNFLQDDGKSPFADEFARLLFEIKNTYTPSDGVIEFIPEDD